MRGESRAGILRGHLRQNFGKSQGLPLVHLDELLGVPLRLELQRRRRDWGSRGGDDLRGVCWDGCGGLLLCREPLKLDGVGHVPRNTGHGIPVAGNEHRTASVLTAHVEAHLDTPLAERLVARVELLTLDQRGADIEPPEALLCGGPFDC